MLNTSHVFSPPCYPHPKGEESESEILHDKPKNVQLMHNWDVSPEPSDLLACALLYPAAVREEGNFIV